MNLGVSSWRWVLVLLVGGSVLLWGRGACAQPAPGPAAQPQPGIDVQDYDFSLTLSDTTDRIEGTATVRLRVETDTLTAVRLDLVGRSAGEDTGMRVASVFEEGATVSYHHTEDLLRIAPSVLREGQTRTFRIEYAGVPADGLIIGTNQHGARTFFGDNWPNRARHWLPVVDHLSDKATVAFRVTAPAQYEVVSNGALVADSTSGDVRHTHWRTDVPLPPKVMVIGAADFAVDTAGTVDGVPVQSWVYPEDRGRGFEDLGQAPPILRFFEDKLGPYPYEKLANVQSTTRYGGMENAAAIFYSETAVADGEDDTPLLAHEIAHQWYGNTVTEADWPHLWLSEGFATYLTGLYLEHARGEAALRRYMTRAREQAVRFHEQTPDEPLVDTTYSDPNELLNTNPYQKGAWVLHMLRREVGTEPFWAGLRAYYERYRDRNASTRDFRAVMEDVSGQDLEAFFDQWTRRPGHPVIEGTWRHDATANECVVTLRQTQDEPPFEVPVEVAVGDAPSRTTTLFLQGRDAQARVDCPHVPSSVRLDPNTDLLAELSMRRADE
ncbi:M1 family metallopeptidase [Salinibacter altiplanensis]|uniref:M1 family metallopeptidase n=1 Tax=Salinibacter altiplanensis TaxID=1803181 RepID=UPI000C9F0063|nr:M1 family metallopeptidase [Salinibacter altiplanensis]